jgi:hypothetical protein
MSYPIFVRRFEEKKAFLSNTSIIPPSRYVPFPMKDSLYRALNNFSDMNVEDYIIGPLYSQTVEKSVEFQIGVTGTVESKEDFPITVSRELAEEVGLLPNSMKHLREIKKYKWKRAGRDDTEFHVYFIAIGDCLPVKETKCLSNDQAHEMKKAGCFVYGSEKSILKFLNQDEIIRYQSNDCIEGVVAIQISVILDILNRMRR